MLNIRTNITRKNVIFNCRSLNAIKMQMFSNACDQTSSGYFIVCKVQITQILQIYMFM